MRQIAVPIPTAMAWVVGNLILGLGGYRHFSHVTLELHEVAAEVFFDCGRTDWVFRIRDLGGKTWGRCLN
jgi:hypothetical protein